MRSLKLVTAVVLLGLLAQGAPSAGPQQAQTPPAPVDVPGQDAIPVFRSGINFVRVDVIVTDKKGEPVHDLTAADFEVREDDVPQTIEQFKLVRVDRFERPADAPIREIRDRDDVEREAAFDDVRIFVFFLDDYHTRDMNAMAIRRQLQQFVETTLRPADMVAFMYPLSPLDTITFTRDRQRILSTIDRFVGRKYKYQPLNVFEERYADYPTEQVEAIRNQVVIGALRGLSIFLGGIRDGRKAIIYVSEGLTTSLPPSMRNQNSQFLNPATARRDSPIEETASFFNYSDIIQRLRSIVDEANRSNTSFYTIDPRGLAVSEFQIDEDASFQQDRRILQQTQDTLRTLAEGTDGKAVVGRNDLGKGLAQAARDTSAYYLLGYNSSQAPSDGRFHAIKVTLSERARRRGLQVRARRGYLAPTAEDVRRVTAPKPVVDAAVASALATLAVRAAPHEVVRYGLIADRATAPGRTRVTLVWEGLPVARPGRSEAPARVSVIAASPSGALLFRGKVAAAADQPGSAPAGTVSFDAPPGDIDLRLSVEGESGGVLDTITKTVSVPARTGGLSTPRFYRGRTPRDVQALLGAEPGRPTLERRFSRLERLVVRVEAYDAAPTLAVLNRNGDRMTEVPVRVLAAPGYGAEIPLANLAPGDYLIELTAPGTRELVAISVGA